MVDDIFSRGIRSIVENNASLNSLINTTEQFKEDVFESRKIVELPNGGRKIEKLVEKHTGNANSENPKIEKTLTEFFKFPNHTFRKIEREGNNLTKKDDSLIECVETIDCNSTSYCDKLSYTCKGCLREEETCTQNDECCPGHTCDNNICKKLSGQEGDYCESASDCNKNYCCALDDNGDGVCQSYLQEGEECGKDIFESFFSAQSSLLTPQSDLPNKCPCQVGLKCKKRRSLMFLESELCTREINSKTNQKMIKIRIQKLPSFSFPNEDDVNDVLLPGLLPGEVSQRLNEFKVQKKKLKKKKKKLRKKKKDIPFGKSYANRNVHKRRNRNKYASFFPKVNFLNPFIDDMHEDSGEFDDDNEKLEDIENEEEDIERARNKRELSEDFSERTRNKRELLEDFSEDARDAVHEAVDGIFDSIMKGIAQAMKYRM